MIIRNFSLVVKAVIIKDGKVLLLRKSDHEMNATKINKYIKLDMPGGAIQFFEKNTEGLRREIKEETGLHVNIVKPIGVYDAIKSHIHLTVITYLCTCQTTNVSLSYEHDEYYWLTSEELENFEMPGWLKKYYLIALEEYKNMKELNLLDNK